MKTNLTHFFKVSVIGVAKLAKFLMNLLYQPGVPRMKVPIWQFSVLKIASILVGSVRSVPPPTMYPNYRNSLKQNLDLSKLIVSLASVRCFPTIESILQWVLKSGDTTKRSSK